MSCAETRLQLPVPMKKPGPVSAHSLQQAIGGVEMLSTAALDLERISVSSQENTRADLIAGAVLNGVSLSRIPSSGSASVL